MYSEDNYQKIYKLLESDFLTSVLKRGRKFDETENSVFWYVDIGDFEEFNFTFEEENFLVDCLRQMGIVVYDRYGNEYEFNENSQEKDSEYNYKNKHETIEKIALYRKTKDIKLRNELIVDNLIIVQKVAKKIADDYQLPYDELVQIGSEYLVYIIDEFNVKKKENFYHYTYMRMMKYLLRRVISSFDYGNKNKKIIRVYLDAKKNVESVYGETLNENPKLMDEIIDLMIEEHGSDNKVFSHAEELLDYRRRLSNSEYNRLLSGNYRNTRDGYEYRNKVNANLEPVGIDELLEQFDIFKNDEYELYDKKQIISKLMEAISELSDREQKIIRMRYGFDDGHCMSLEDIGKKIGRTKQLVSTRLHKIIDKLKIRLLEMLDENYLKEYFMYESEYLEENKKTGKR